jgi:hypothetical protein
VSMPGIDGPQGGAWELRLPMSLTLSPPPPALAQHHSMSRNASLEPSARIPATDHLCLRSLNNDAAIADGACLRRGGRNCTLASRPVPIKQCCPSAPANPNRVASCPPHRRSMRPQSAPQDAGAARRAAARRPQSATQRPNQDAHANGRLDGPPSFCTSRRLGSSTTSSVSEVAARRRVRPTSAKALKHRRVIDDGADSLIYEDIEEEDDEDGMAISDEENQEYHDFQEHHDARIPRIPRIPSQGDDESIVNTPMPNAASSRPRRRAPSRSAQQAPDGMAAKSSRCLSRPRSADPRSTENRRRASMARSDGSGADVYVNAEGEVLLRAPQLGLSDHGVHGNSFEVGSSALPSGAAEVATPERTQPSIVFAPRPPPDAAPPTSRPRPQALLQRSCGGQECVSVISPAEKNTLGQGPRASSPPPRRTVAPSNGDDCLSASC